MNRSGTAARGFQGLAAGVPNAAWRSLDLAELLVLLEMRRIRPPYPVAEAAQLDHDQRQARRSDVSRRLGRADPDPELGSLIDACADHHQSVDLRFSRGTDETAALVLASGTGTFVIHADGEHGRFLRCPAHLAVANMLAVLRPLPAPAVPALALPQEVLVAISDATPATASRAERDRILRPAGITAAVFDHFQAAVGNAVGAGQIGASRRNGDEVRRSARVVGFADGERGRVITEASVQGGVPWLTFRPAGPADLHRAASDLIQTLAR